jgi:DNA-binding transcriptional regulator YiaG
MKPALAKKRIHRLARTGQLAELRDSLGLTRGDVARHLGVNQSTVWRWEAGDIRPRGQHAVALLELLELLEAV